ncbi:MAG: copper-binding protein [Aphanocapsa feldmannii 277cV]|uniref:Copper-binding protein n=2 Tax=Aphanocapsa feldmannii TaxID=192050 RepID=A0A524RL89_9CHRO|nr:MAG: copper-binding protein [Aphanocapsa feldmannii 288cV]TGG90839.1 MAG: copper-binding protein [Aphanocapsa feldmannii 277cV]TGH22664.1 MAG: copper-binding protein [Aphanocapsa feldmannii 277cI]
MANPFQVRWLEGWSFQLILQGGRPVVEAQGFGVWLQKPLLPGESPGEAADRILWREEQRRRSMHGAWRRSEGLLLGNSAVPLVRHENGGAQQPQQPLLTLFQHQPRRPSPRDEVLRGLG